MHWTPGYRKAVIAPAETRQECACRCLLSNRLTSTGIRLAMATEAGRYQPGEYHPPCPGCFERPQVKALTVREIDRAKFLYRPSPVAS